MDTETYYCPKCGNKQTTPTPHCDACYNYLGVNGERWLTEPLNFDKKKGAAFSQIL